MLSKENRKAVLEKIREMEKCILADEQGASIGSVCLLTDRRSVELLHETDPIAPVLRTALVINWPETAMKRRYERFRSKFPEVNTLQRLKETIDQTGALEFCREYLDINANQDRPKKNPKYLLLTTLTNAFLEYQRAMGIATEIDALRTWALNVKLCSLRNDPIGSKRGVGIGVVENVRLNLGYHVIKPDRHAIGVMRQCLDLDIQPENYFQLAEALGLSPRSG